MLAKTITTLTATLTYSYVDVVDTDKGLSHAFEENGYWYEWRNDSTSFALYNRYKIITITETQIEVSDKIVPKKDPEEKERYRKEAEQLREEALKKQREEEALAVQKAAEKLNSDLIEQINKAIEQALNSAATGQGAVAVIKTDYFTCFTQGMLDILKAHPEVSYEIHYLYQGKHYVLTIPAGADLSSLESSDGYYGFRYLDSIFGGYEEME